VAGSALALVEGFAARGLGLINGKREGRRVQIQQKVRDLFEARRDYGLGRGADGHGGGVIALLELIVIAVPVQVQILARALVPNLRQVNRADGAVIRHMEYIEFGGIERVHAACPLDWPAGLPGISNLLFQQSVFGDGDNQVLVDQTLKPRRLVNRVDRLEHIGRREARIARAVIQEVLERLEVDRVRGRPQDDLRGIAR